MGPILKANAAVVRDMVGEGLNFKTLEPWGRADECDVVDGKMFEEPTAERQIERAGNEDNESKGRRYGATRCREGGSGEHAYGGLGVCMVYGAVYGRGNSGERTVRLTITWMAAAFVDDGC